MKILRIEEVKSPVQAWAGMKETVLSLIKDREADYRFAFHEIKDSCGQGIQPDIKLAEFGSASLKIDAYGLRLYMPEASLPVVGKILRKEDTWPGPLAMWREFASQLMEWDTARFLAVFERELAARS